LEKSWKLEVSKREIWLLTLTRMIQRTRAYPLGRPDSHKMFQPSAIQAHWLPHHRVFLKQTQKIIPDYACHLARAFPAICQALVVQLKRFEYKLLVGS
jgi:hypothetical protein